MGAKTYSKIVELKILRLKAPIWRFGGRKQKKNKKMINMKSWISQQINNRTRISIPIMTHPGIEMIGKTVKEAVQSGDVHAQAIKKLAEVFPSAATTVIMDLTLEAEAFGCQIEFQENDEEIAQGIVCASFKCGNDRIHKILSPISGRIVEVNDNIKSNPNLIEKDPYFEGWIYRVIPANIEYEIKYLIPCSSDRI